MWLNYFQIFKSVPKLNILNIILKQNYFHEYFQLSKNTTILYSQTFGKLELIN